MASSQEGVPADGRSDDVRETSEAARRDGANESEREGDEGREGRAASGMCSRREAAEG